MDNQLKPGQSIDILKVLRYFLRHWYVFAGSVLLAVAITTVYQRFQPHVYSLSTTMMIEDKTANILLPDGMTSIINSRGIDNEIALLKSYSQVSRIIDRLDFEVSYFSKGEMSTREIYRDSPFIVRFDPEANRVYERPVVIRFSSGQEFSLSTPNGDFDPKKTYQTGQLVESQGFAFTVALNESPGIGSPAGRTYSFVLHTKDHLVKSYKSKISIRLERGTSLLTVSSSGTNINKEKDFLNTLAKVYIDDNLERKNQISNNTISFIDEQLAQIRESLAEVESRLENFRKDNKLMRLTDKAGPILQRVNNLEKSKADQMLDLKYYQYLKEYLLTHDEVDDIVAPSTVGISLPLFSDLLLKLSTTYLEKEDLMANSSKENPYIQTLETEINNQKRVLLENISDVIRIAEMKIDDYDMQIEKNLREFDLMPTLERQYIEIERINKLNSEMYTYLLEKRAEAGIARANDVADLVLVDRAGDSGITRIAPNTKASLISSVLLALAIPSLILFLLFLLNHKLTEPEELAGISVVPLAGVLGNYRNRTPLSLFQVPHHDFLQAIRKLRVRIPAGEAGNGKTIGVTSAIFRDGKTFLASSLALSYAAAGKKTLLVDLGFDRQGAGDLFSSEIPHTIKSGEPVPVNGIPNLDLYLPAGLQDLDDLFTKGALKEQLNGFRKQYDVIICDLSPAGLTSDAQEMAPLIDTCLFVARERHTPRKLLFQALEQISHAGLAARSLLVYNGASSAGKSSSYDYYRQKENKKGLARLVFQLKHRLS